MIEKLRYIIMGIALLLGGSILADMFLNDFSVYTIYAGSAIAVCIVYLTVDAVILNYKRSRRR